jgi:hypothetical protein
MREVTGMNDKEESDDKSISRRSSRSGDGDDACMQDNDLGDNMFTLFCLSILSPSLRKQKKNK